MNDIREKIKAEFRACRTSYEVFRINIGMLQEYPKEIVDEERNKRLLEFTTKKIFKNREVQK